MTAPGLVAAEWHRTALEPSRAHGAPLSAADVKTHASDFRVEEQLSFTPSGDGPHFLLWVEKSGANTPWVAAQLARHAGVGPDAVGYAGLKDRHAVTRQWFSVPAGATTADHWRALRAPEFSVIDALRNARKLKRGALRGNRFQIRLRNAAWQGAALGAKIAAIRAYGVPNYFGPQRFGRDAQNLARLAAWAGGGAAPRGRLPRSFALSAARALLFNAVLARRVTDGTWSTLAPGDLAILDGSGSHFRVGPVDAELRRREHLLDLHPSGPLWGRGEPATDGAALDLERAVGRDHAEVVALLESQGLRQERRALRCRVDELEVDVPDGMMEVTLRFTLGRGQFATAVLREICDFDAHFGAHLEDAMDGA